MNLLNYKWWKQFLVGNYYEFVFRVVHKSKWKQVGSFKQRKFKDYKQYLKVQKAKINYTDLSEHSVLFYKRLNERIKSIQEIKEKGSVLCLGARDGIEVKAFRNNGFFAWGIDLKPSKNNEYVTTGDFHSIKLNDNSVDVIFTNSLDHSFDLDQVLEESARVLKSDGILIVECGTDGGYGLHESFMWKDVDTLINAISSQGFSILSKRNIDYQQFSCVSLVFRNEVL